MAGYNTFYYSGNSYGCHPFKSVIFTCFLLTHILKLQEYQFLIKQIFLEIPYLSHIVVDRIYNNIFDFFMICINKFFCSRFAESLVEFLYEYDDFFRLRTVTITYNDVRLQPQKYQYDSRQGRLTKLNNFVFLYDLYTRRIMGEKVILFRFPFSRDYSFNKESFIFLAKRNSCLLFTAASREYIQEIF